MDYIEPSMHTESNEKWMFNLWQLHGLQENDHVKRRENCSEIRDAL